MSWQSSDGQVVLYLDGVEAYSGFVNQGHVIGDGGTVVLGQEQDTVGGGFQDSQAFLGQLSDVRIWDEVRTAEEVDANYDVRLDGSEAGLVTYWSLNEGSGTTAQDLTATGNDGTVNGASWTAGNVPLGTDSDTLSGIENLIGTGFDDTLIGDPGDNTLEGGAGIDIYIFASISDGRDAILDFSVGEDVIDLDELFDGM